jgi:hypothetical protein
LSCGHRGAWASRCPPAARADADGYPASRKPLGPMMSEQGKLADIREMNDPDFLTARARLRAELEHVPEGAPGRTALDLQWNAMTDEFDRRARAAWRRAS